MTATTPPVETIGFIGLGRMGAPMAQHLLRAGFRVQGFDIVLAACERHRAAGGMVAASVAAAVHGADLVITMLDSDESLQSIVEGNDGLLEVLRPPQMLVDVGTSRVGTIRRLAVRMGQAGIPLLDAPVTGGVHGAEQGTLDVIVGGEAEVVERCRPVFAAMSRKVTHVGPVGCGLLAKYVNQLVMAATFCAAAEGLALATKGGADPARTWEAINSGLAASPLLQATMAAILADTYGQGAELRLFFKDTSYALAAASELMAWLPTTAQTHEVFKLALQAGFGGGSAPGVAQLWEQLMDVRLQSD
jgi:3-hydroxyisobutyrate dehydrogenase-like beta-hydroxyacid dehydrogenase